MKTIGMIGGMSWESTLEYYRLLNEGVKAELGGLHSAKLLMYSLDFSGIEELQRLQDWERATEVMIGIARRLELGGAELLMICTNTMHKMADEVQAAIGVPLLHIADAAAAEIKHLGLNRVGLLGTRFTMEQDFYKGRLKDKHGIDVMIPSDTDMELVHNVIYNELCLGELKAESKKRFLKIIGRLADEGAEGIVLGCTEIPLLISQEDTELPVLNTTKLHAAAAVKASLAPVSE